jgi:ABC-type antimicrobial peptide transport system permease subunit
VIGTGREILSGPFMFLRAAGLAALALGALTLLLAMVGLFGVQSHIVARRTREIGVRMSLGASAVQIKRMVLTDGCSPVVEGLALGLFIGLAGRAVVRAYLDIEVSVVDPWMLLTVPIPLIVAAFCACYLPAHRAAAVDPGVALRHL